MYIQCVCRVGVRASVCISCFLWLHAFTRTYLLYSLGIEDSYLHTVAVIYLDCLKLLTFCLRSGLAMSREKGKGISVTSVLYHISPPSPTLCLFVPCVADMQKETDGSAAASGGTPERQNSKPPLLRVTSVTDHPEVFDEIGEMEKEFCFSMFDRLMGLLALMLPKEKEVSDGGVRV